MKNTNEKTFLPREEFERMKASLEEPGKPIPALVEAIKGYHERVVSR